MSDNEATKAKASSWTDRERLAYLVSVIEHSETKLNFKASPLPAGRTQIACERMFSRLKTTLKAELEALKKGMPMPMPINTSTSNAAASDGALKKGDGAAKKGTPRKRKVGAVEGEQGSPVKKGRGGKGGEKGGVDIDVDADVNEGVKSEVKNEEEEEEI